MFRRAGSTRAYEDVAEQIRQAIIDGRLKPGERLPPGRELAITFGVGRATLLAALRNLEQSGLIVTRVGTKGGSFVVGPSIRQVSESLDLLLQREGATLEELAEFRELLEGQCAYRAALRASEDEVREMERRYQEMWNCLALPGAQWRDFMSQETELHRLLVQLSGNRFSAAVWGAIHATMDRAFRLIPPNTRDTILEDWRRILDAIKGHSAAEAEALIRRHIAFFNSILIQEARLRMENERLAPPSPSDTAGR